jgi:SAM-dependent methyltransferase
VSVISSPVGTALDKLGLSRWFEDIAGAAYTQDPWVAFERVYEAARDSNGHFRQIVDLFIRNRPVPKRIVQSALGEEATLYLQQCGALYLTEESQIYSKFCLLSAFGLYLFMEWPTRTPLGRFIASRTYLSRGSYDCASEILRVHPRGCSLDLGSGSGLLTMLAARSAAQSFGTDLDLTAAQLSKLNLGLNGLEASIVQCDGTSCLRPGRRFDLIVVNPPWRIVPPGIAYPNPVARMGLGSDGLDQVRCILRSVPQLLSPGGQAIVRFDLPRGIAVAETILADTTTFLGSRFGVETKILGMRSIDEQAEVSADTCSHLNSNTDLKAAFLDYYRHLNVHDLLQLICVIRDEAGAPAQFVEH